MCLLVTKESICHSIDSHPAFLLHLNYFVQGLTFNDIQVTKCPSFQQQLCPQQYYKVRKFEDFQAPALFSSTCTVKALYNSEKKFKDFQGCMGTLFITVLNPKASTHFTVPYWKSRHGRVSALLYTLWDAGRKICHNIMRLLSYPASSSLNPAFTTTYYKWPENTKEPVFQSVARPFNAGQT